MAGLNFRIYEPEIIRKFGSPKMAEWMRKNFPRLHKQMLDGDNTETVDAEKRGDYTVNAPVRRSY